MPTDREQTFAVWRFAYWILTGGEGDLPWGLRLPMLGYVVMSVLAFSFVLMALFTRLGED